MGDSGQFLSLAVPIAKVLVPIGLGLFLRLIGMFGDDEGVVLRKFVVRFTVPIFVFFSIYEAETDSIAAIGPMMLALPLLSVVLFLLGWAVASRFQGGPRRAAVHACITFCNYGWLGWGVAAALLGREGLQRAVYFTLLWWPVFYAFGLPIGLIHTGKQGGGVPLRRTLTVALPPLAAMALGLAANLGNGHTLAAIMAGKRIDGLVEHHTGLLESGSFGPFIRRFAAGGLSDEQVFNDGGHGCIPPGKGMELESPVIVTGPRRQIARGSGLKLRFAAPHGDMMMTGCFGLVEAWKSVISGPSS